MKKPDFRLWDGKKMRYNAIVGNGQALYIPDGLGEYKWVNLAEVVAMEKTDFVDEDRKVIYESDILEDKEGNIGAVVWIKEWGMFGVLVGDEFEDYINGGVKKLEESLFWTFPVENFEFKKIGNIYENTNWNIEMSEQEFEEWEALKRKPAE